MSDMMENKETPLFSIIVPVYGVEKYLNECVKSLQKQTYKNIEIILVDDGSKDKSPQICDQLAKEDSRIKVIHKKNGGVESARREGAKLASGEYIACIDGDDWVSEEYFEVFTKVIMEYQPDVVCCDAIWRYDHKDIKTKMCVPYGFYNREQMEKSIFPLLIENEEGLYFPSSLWAKVFKKSIYKSIQLQLDLKISMGEDSACTKLCMYNAQSVFLVEKNLYFYRQNDQSLTKKAFKWNTPLILGRFFEEAFPLEEFHFEEQIYRNVVHILFTVVVSQFNRKESYFKLRKEIVKELDTPYYRQAIDRCSYTKRNWRGKLALLSLKYKWIGLAYLYNKI